MPQKCERGPGHAVQAGQCLGESPELNGGFTMGFDGVLTCFNHQNVVSFSDFGSLDCHASLPSNTASHPSGFGGRDGRRTTPWPCPSQCVRGHTCR